MSLSVFSNLTPSSAVHDFVVRLSSEDVSSCLISAESYNLGRFGKQERRQEDFWKESQKIINKTTTLITKKSSEIKLNIITRIKHLTLDNVNKKSESYVKSLDNLSLLVNKHNNKHELLMLSLCLDRMELAKNLDDERYLDFIDCHDSSIDIPVTINTAITWDEYYNYHDKFRDLAKKFSPDLNNKVFSVIMKDNLPLLMVYPSKDFLQTDNSLNIVIDWLNPDSDDQKNEYKPLKLLLIADLYINTYFSFQVSRGAAHNSLMLLCSFLQYTFPNEPLPHFGEHFLDLELFQDVNYEESKNRFINKFIKGDYFT